MKEKHGCTHTLLRSRQVSRLFTCTWRPQKQTQASDWPARPHSTAQRGMAAGSRWQLPPGHVTGPQLPPTPRDLLIRRPCLDSDDVLLLFDACERRRFLFLTDALQNFEVPDKNANPHVSPQRKPEPLLLVQVAIPRRRRPDSLITT